MENIICKYSVPNCSINTLLIGDVIWFKAKSITKVLQYTNTSKALKDHVWDEYKMSRENLKGGNDSLSPLNGNDLSTTWVSEAGMFQLIFSSKMEQAKLFTKWIVEEVLPSIRKTGSYAVTQAVAVTQSVKEPQMSILNETDLHKKVIDFIRKYYPEAVIVAGLGELQDTQYKRSDAYHKGYKGGQPDIMILNWHKHYTGFALELKTPKGDGKLSEKQEIFLKGLECNKYKTLISNDYDEILMQIIEYFRDARVPCQCCNRCFKSVETLETHRTKFHK